MTATRREEPPVTTPDGRYIVVRRRLWRAANPHLTPDIRQRWVQDLMSARRSIRMALASKDSEALKAARASVHACKTALGERGQVWWTDGTPDLNRRMIADTPYAQWWASR